ncbi:hypothetical protein [Acidiferrobacter sp.]|uniref:hypothetical protein n=1 Tax=Acidiferrobacter sp. TaxID=1872107 RepID=UPI0026097EE1|nr:hypothetical protein [Acidiferrobacter sp.]
MSRFPTVSRILARGLLILGAAAMLSGCFFVPPGAYVRHGCYGCSDHPYSYHRRDHGDDD